MCPPQASLNRILQFNKKKGIKEKGITIVERGKEACKPQIITSLNLNKFKYNPLNKPVTSHAANLNSFKLVFKSIIIHLTIIQHIA